MATKWTRMTSSPTSTSRTDNSLEDLNLTSTSTGGGQVLESFFRPNTAVCAGTLSRSKKPDRTFDKTGLTRAVLLQRRFKTFSLYSALTVHPGGTNSLCTIPRESKKNNNQRGPCFGASNPFDENRL